MKISVICSNYHSISAATKSGTVIFLHSFINNLAKEKHGFDVTVFAAGESSLPFTVDADSHDPLVNDADLVLSGKHFIFELALIARAFSRQEDFDIYHVNIGDGDIALPFSFFVNKPIVITIHNVVDKDFTRRYFALFKDCRHVYFISASDSQRRVLPELNYYKTIYHGVDENLFMFDSNGGSAMMWAGRAIPEKGPELAVDVARRTGRAINLFGIIKDNYKDWFQSKVLDPIAAIGREDIMVRTDHDRWQLIKHYQASKLFLFPIDCEESFGFVLAEAMSCGTPVVAFARGAVPEVVVDGQTGFIVNFSETDQRGDWIIKKTGLAGLQEAVEMIYSLSTEEYLAMRRRCRERVEENFTIKRMVGDYVAVYKELAAKTKT